MLKMLHSVKTVVSSLGNTYHVQLFQKKSLWLIDIPGHDRVRQLYFDKFKASARYRWSLYYVLHVQICAIYLQH